MVTALVLMWVASWPVADQFLRPRPLPGNNIFRALRHWAWVYTIPLGSREKAKPVDTYKQNNKYRTLSFFKVYKHSPPTMSGAREVTTSSGEYWMISQSYKKSVSPTHSRFVESHMHACRTLSRVTSKCCPTVIFFVMLMKFLKSYNDLFCTVLLLETSA